jgi:hypothetical protein
MVGAWEQWRNGKNRSWIPGMAGGTLSHPTMPPNLLFQPFLLNQGPWTVDHFLLSIHYSNTPFSPLYQTSYILVSILYPTLVTARVTHNKKSSLLLKEYRLLTAVVALLAWAMIVTPAGNGMECALSTSPENFMWGLPSSGLQSEEHNPASQRTSWAAMGRTPDQPGLAANFLHRYREDIKLAKPMNVNPFRISIDWSRIKPEQVSYDASATALSADRINAIVAE